MERGWMLSRGRLICGNRSAPWAEKTRRMEGQRWDVGQQWDLGHYWDVGAALRCRDSSEM